MTTPNYYGEPLHRNQTVITESANLITALRHMAPSLMYASMTTDDGFEVTSFNRLPVPGIGEDGRVSSMVSSLQGLAEAVMTNLILGDIEFTLLSTDSGNLIVRRVPGYQLVFCGVFDKYENLGKVLPATKMIAEQLAAAINPNDPFA